MYPNRGIDPRATAQAHALNIAIVAALHSGGAHLLLGTDTVKLGTIPGFSLHDELDNFVKAGLTPYEAIRAGTADAAIFLREEKEFGTVSVGQRADLLLLNKNPLDDVRNTETPAGVMTGGRWHTAEDLKEQLRTLRATYKHPAVVAQSAAPASQTHVVIPFLADASKSTDIEFEGGECELDASRNGMACTFQQVFLTMSAVAPDTCLITTNRYDRVFRREAASRWTSTEGPDGLCGVLDVATLQDDGGVQWTMETHKVVTKRNASPTCEAFDTRSVTLGWQNIRRPLPCRFVQPGALSR